VQWLAYVAESTMTDKVQRFFLVAVVGENDSGNTAVLSLFQGIPAGSGRNRADVDQDRSCGGRELLPIGR